jgi:hypothetical protein
MRERWMNEEESSEYYLENIYWEIRNDSDWVGVVEVHPHGLERIRFIMF